MPVADGGEGTADRCSAAHEVEPRTVRSAAPSATPSMPRSCSRPDGSAVVECAAASGLGLVTEAERDAWAASTYGTGRADRRRRARPARRPCWWPWAGSATTDGGAGAVEALKEAGVKPRMEVLCDVRTPFEDAARVFGPQKGADPAMVKRLSKRLRELAAAAPKDPRGVPMTGAAGGLAGGLWAHFGAKLRAGRALRAGGARLRRRDARRRCSWSPARAAWTASRWRARPRARWPPAAASRGCACRAVVGSVELDEFEERILDLEAGGNRLHARRDWRPPGPDA